MLDYLEYDEDADEIRLAWFPDLDGLRASLCRATYLFTMGVTRLAGRLRLDDQFRKQLAEIWTEIDTLLDARTNN